MKKILFAAMAICVGMTSCMNEDFPYAPNYGYINVNVTNDPVISTRAAVTGDDLESWTIMAGDYDLNDNNKIPAGTYTVKASNYASDVDALGANNNWGDAFYTGSSNVTLVAGDTKEVSIACGTAKNSRLKVKFTLDNNAFKNYYLVADRNLTFKTGNVSDSLAYYNVGQDVKVSYTLHYTYGTNEPRSLPGTIAMTEAAKEYELSISSNSNGTITITEITYDDTFTVVEGGSIEFDAATGEVIDPENNENVQE